jgi:hypothetical protein
MFSRGFHLFFEMDTSPMMKMKASIRCVKWPSNPKKLISGQFGQKPPSGMAPDGRGVGLPGSSPWTAGFPQAVNGIPQHAAMLPVARFGRFTVKHYTMLVSAKSKRDRATRHTSCF